MCLDQHPFIVIISISFLTTYTYFVFFENLIGHKPIHQIRNITNEIKNNQWEVIEKYIKKPQVMIKISYEDSDVFEYLYRDNLDKLTHMGYNLKQDNGFSTIKCYYLQRIDDHK